MYFPNFPFVCTMLPSPLRPPLFVRLNGVENVSPVAVFNCSYVDSFNYIYLYIISLILYTTKVLFFVLKK